MPQVLFHCDDYAVDVETFEYHGIDHVHFNVWTTPTLMPVVCAWFGVEAESSTYYHSPYDDRPVSIQICDYMGPYEPRY